MPVTPDILERLQARIPASTPDTPGAVASIAYQCGDEMEAFIVGRQQDVTAHHATIESRFLVMSITKSLPPSPFCDSLKPAHWNCIGRYHHGCRTFPHASRITIRHLLQHTSGLPDYGPLADYHEAVRRGDRPWTFNEFLERTNAEELRFQPGQGWSYSNIGYMLLRRLLETVRKRSFAEIITAGVCRPLNLSHTALVESKA